MVAGVFIVALSDELEERNAALPARKGIKAVAGLAVHIVSSGGAGSFFDCKRDQPRRAIEAADRVVENMLATNRKERCRGRSGEEWRGKTWGGGRGVAKLMYEVGAAKGLAKSISSRFWWHLIGWGTTTPPPSPRLLHIHFLDPRIWTYLAQHVRQGKNLTCRLLVTYIDDFARSRPSLA